MTTPDNSEIYLAGFTTPLYCSASPHPTRHGILDLLKPGKSASGFMCLDVTSGKNVKEPVEFHVNIGEIVRIEAERIELPKRAPKTKQQSQKTGETNFISFVVWSVGGERKFFHGIHSRFLAPIRAALADIDTHFIFFDSSTAENVFMSKAHVAAIAIIDARKMSGDARKAIIEEMLG